MDLQRSQLPSALLAWIDRVGCAEPLASSLPSSARWLLTLWGRGDDHLPLHLVHDLGHLLLRGRDFRFASTGSLARWSDAERAGRLAYEDKVLGRWALDPTVLDAHVAIAGMSAARRDDAVAHAVGLALSGPLLAAEDLARANPAHLRPWIAELPAVAADDAATLHEKVSEEWRAWAEAQHAACVRALPPGRLFHAEDLWEIAHLAELPSESARLALRTILGLTARVGPVSPSVALSLRHKAREVPIEAEEADQYPAGGFDAISTRGTFENLVRSEVAYVGEGSTERGGVDLFDVRFAENELLFYTRDATSRWCCTAPRRSGTSTRRWRRRPWCSRRRWRWRSRATSCGCSARRGRAAPSCGWPSARATSTWPRRSARCSRCRSRRRWRTGA